MTIFATTFQGIACKLYEVLGIDAQKYVTICQVMRSQKVSRTMIFHHERSLGKVFMMKNLEGQEISSL